MMCINPWLYRGYAVVIPWLYRGFDILVMCPRRLVLKGFSACKIPDHFRSTWVKTPYKRKWSGILQLRKKYQAPRTNRIE